MTQPAPAPFVRPAPGHYQVRLGAVLTRRPLQSPPPLPAAEVTPRRTEHCSRRRRSRQLSLALPPA